MIGLLTFLALQSPLSEQVRQSPAVATYLLCTGEQAGRLETSGESADSIATASAATCDGMVDYAAETMIMDAAGRDYAELRPSELAQLRAAARERLRRAGRDIATTRVVAMRARR